MNRPKACAKGGNTPPFDGEGPADVRNILGTEQAPGRAVSRRSPDALGGTLGYPVICFFTNPHNRCFVWRLDSPRDSARAARRAGVRCGPRVRARGVRAAPADRTWIMVETRRHAADQCSSVAESDCDMCEITLRPYSRARPLLRLVSRDSPYHRSAAGGTWHTSTISQTRENLA